MKLEQMRDVVVLGVVVYGYTASASERVWGASFTTSRALLTRHHFVLESQKTKGSVQEMIASCISGGRGCFGLNIRGIFSVGK